MQRRLHSGLLCLLSLWLAGCGSSSSPTNYEAMTGSGSGPASTGAPAALYSPGTTTWLTQAKTLDLNGGTISAPAGSALAGVTISVPPGALKTPTAIRIGSDSGTLTPIEGTFNGQTLVLDTGAQHLFDQPISITVPLKQGVLVPYYVSADGKLNLMEIRQIDRVNGRETFISYHASTFAFVQTGTPSTNPFDTGFRPDKDGFNIANNGSQYERLGECLGFTSFALWYFRSGFDSIAPLYSSFLQNVANPGGGFASAQNLIVTRAFISEQNVFNEAPFDKYELSLPSVPTEADYFAVINNAMRNTGLPVLLGLQNLSKAHSTLAYALNGNQITIYDPNLPGTSNSVTFDPTQNTMTYEDYDTIYYYGDGGFPFVHDPFTNILLEAEGATTLATNVTITSHTNGEAVANPRQTIKGKATSNEVLVSAMKIMVGSTPYTGPIQPDGSFSIDVVIPDHGENHLKFVGQGSNQDGGTLDVATSLDSTDFVLNGTFGYNTVDVVLSWDDSSAQLGLVMVDPTGDFAAPGKNSKDGAVGDPSPSNGSPQHVYIPIEATTRYDLPYDIRVAALATSGPVSYHVAVLLNGGTSSVQAFHFDQVIDQPGFTIIGPPGTVMNSTIPPGFMEVGSFRPFVVGSQPPTPPYNAETPLTHLGFDSGDPTTATAGSVIAPIRVFLVEQGGSLAKTATNPVTISLFNANGATLSGTTTVNATSGVATFSDLSIDRPGTYGFLVTSGNLTAANSFSSEPLTVSSASGTSHGFVYVADTQNSQLVRYSFNPAVAGALSAPTKIPVTGGVSQIYISKDKHYLITLSSQGNFGGTQNYYAIDPSTGDLTLDNTDNGILFNLVQSLLNPAIFYATLNHGGIPHISKFSFNSNTPHLDFLADLTSDGAAVNATNLAPFTVGSDELIYSAAGQSIQTTNTTNSLTTTLPTPGTQTAGEVAVVFPASGSALLEVLITNLSGPGSLRGIPLAANGNPIITSATDASVGPQPRALAATNFSQVYTGSSITSAINGLQINPGLNPASHLPGQPYASHGAPARIRITGMSQQILFALGSPQSTLDEYLINGDGSLSSVANVSVGGNGSDVQAVFFP